MTNSRQPGQPPERAGQIGSMATGSDQQDLRRRASVSGRASVVAQGALMTAEAAAAQALAEEAAARLQIPCYIRWSERLINSNPFSVLMGVLTIIVLVGDDVRLLLFNEDADLVFNVLTILALLLFSLEIVLSSIVKDDYLGGFWFILDLIATVSLLVDITEISNAIMGYQDITYDNIVSASSQQAALAGTEQSEYARASRSSRVGTRVARLLRVVRLVRLSRLKAVWHKIINRAMPHDEDGVVPGESTHDQHHTESKVGKKLSEKTTQRVIILVLVMLVSSSVFMVGEPTVMIPISGQYGADALYQAWYDYDLAAVAATGANLQNKTTLEMQARERRLQWEKQLILYVHYHNPYSFEDERAVYSAWQWNYHLAFLGYVVGDANYRNVPNDPLVNGYVQKLIPNGTNWLDLLYFFPEQPSVTVEQWQAAYAVGHIPPEIQQRLSQPWARMCTEDAGSPLHGVSLLLDMPCPRIELRKAETIWYSPRLLMKDSTAVAMKTQFVFVFDIRERIKWESVFNVVQTVFVVIVLAFGALAFSRDSDNLVLHPIERMISKVMAIRDDPLYAIRLGDEQYRMKEQPSTPIVRRGASASSKDKQGSRAMRARNRLKMKAAGRRRADEATPKNTTMETKVLENAIIKLGSLLALGFGEAGSEIIGQNMDDDNATVNAMIPGTKVEAIYGFCSIRNFTDVTEVLQEKTSVFVNKVAEIVHKTVDSYLGAPNKNIGEAFLLVWRELQAPMVVRVHGLTSQTQLNGREGTCERWIPEKHCWSVRFDTGETKNLRPENLVTQVNDQDKAKLRKKIADLSVMSFIQVVAELNRDAGLAEYREHPALLARLPHFRVGLGFGLHLGWSIEGAIGSEFKIDASYLSPHVNIAGRLESATKQYGTAILMSEPLVRQCSAPLQRYFRAIDHVQIQGTKTSTRLFTVDLNYESLSLEPAGQRLKSKNRYQERREREKSKQAKLVDAYEVHTLFTTDLNVKQMRERFFIDFFQDFEKGYLNYEAGEWDVAERVFQKTRCMLWGDGKRNPEDGPSCTLLDFMKTYNYQAPSGWPGYRMLPEM